MLDLQTLRNDIQGVAAKLKERRNFVMDVDTFVSLESPLARAFSQTPSSFRLSVIQFQKTLVLQKKMEMKKKLPT